jgi:hypothetical protein
MNSCLNCKHAKWARTKNGRINPHQHGNCTWSKSLQVPMSYNSFAAQRKDGEPLVFKGGAIWRKGPYEKCPTFQPESS